MLRSAVRLIDLARAGAALGTLAVSALVGAGCERPELATTAFDAPSRDGLRVVASDVADGVHVGHEAIRVEFDRGLDPASVGARSVRVERAGGHRVRGVRVWSSGARLFVAPPPDRAFPADGDLWLRIEGGGSPRALRGLDGSTAPETERLRFRALRRRRTDLEGPRLLDSVPASGTTDAAPASHVLLIFDEPLARASIRAGDAVVVRVNGRETPARQRLSPDLTRLVVRPKRHLPPGADVVIEVRPALLDLTGNPAEPVSVGFRTDATRLNELTEDFVTTDMLDPAATTGGWSTPEAPGFLVARAGRTRWSAGEGAAWASELPEAPRVRFQTVFPAPGRAGGVASALRLYLVGADDGDLVAAAAVDVGHTSLIRADPTFDANRGASRLVTATSRGEPLVIEIDDSGAPYVDVPFDLPIALLPGAAVLVDVEIALPPGVRLAAAEDSSCLALVESLGVGVLLPATELLVSGGLPQARSGWWDSGIERPGWQDARVVGPDANDADVLVEFQTASATPEGAPDLDRSSEWGPELGQLPALRFVRFRVTFARLGTSGHAPRIDSIVLPYQE